MKSYWYGIIAVVLLLILIFGIMFIQKDSSPTKEPSDTNVQNLDTEQLIDQSLISEADSVDLGELIELDQ